MGDQNIADLIAIWCAVLLAVTIVVFLLYGYSYEIKKILKHLPKTIEILFALVVRYRTAMKFLVDGCFLLWGFTMIAILFGMLPLGDITERALTDNPLFVPSFLLPIDRGKELGFSHDVENLQAIHEFSRSHKSVVFSFDAYLLAIQFAWFLFVLFIIVVLTAGIAVFSRVRQGLPVVVPPKEKPPFAPDEESQSPQRSSPTNRVQTMQKGDRSDKSTAVSTEEDKMRTKMIDMKLRYPNLPSVPSDSLQYEGWFQEGMKRFQMRSQQQTTGEYYKLLKQHTELHLEYLKLAQTRAEINRFNQQTATDDLRLEADRKKIELELKQLELQMAEYDKKIKDLQSPPETPRKSQDDLGDMARKLSKLNEEKERAIKENPKEEDAIAKRYDMLRQEIIEGRR